jgi:O-antigen/teichoic acid export membrane protein
MMMTVSDKVVLSRFVPLGQFGQYGLITLVCQVLPKVTYPFINAYFHEFIVAWQRRDYRRLSGQYQHVSEIINPILIAAGLVLVLFALDIVTLLTGSRIVAGRLELPMQLYALGTLFFTLQFVPHILQLASGWASLSLVISGTAILGYIPAVYLLTPLWGLVAPPAVWLATNLMTFPLFIYMTHKRLLPELKSLWIKKTLLQPAVICALALLGAREVLYPTDTLIGLFGEMTVVALFAAAALFLASYPIRTWTILIAATMMKFARAQK